MDPKVRAKYDPSIPDDLAEEYEREYGFDPFTTFSSGLADEITLRVDNPHFGYDADFQDGQVPLFILEGTVIGGDADPEFSQWYTVGNGWEAAQGGKMLVREKKDGRSLNKSTNYHHLFQSLFDAAKKQGMIDDLRKRRGGLYQSKMWDGLELYMEREEYTNTIGGETKEGSRLLVVSIEKLPNQSTEKPQRSRVTSRPEPSEAANTPTDPSGLSPVLKAKLRKVAQGIKAGGGSHNQFAEAAFSDVDGVLDNAAAEDAVMDTDAGSIWSDA